MYRLSSDMIAWSYLARFTSMPLYKMLLARFTSMPLFKMLVNHTFYGMQSYPRTDGIFISVYPLKLIIFSGYSVKGRGVSWLRGSWVFNAHTGYSKTYSSSWLNTWRFNRVLQILFRFRSSNPLLYFVNFVNCVNSLYRVSKKYTLFQRTSSNGDNYGVWNQLLESLEIRWTVDHFK